MASLRDLWNIRYTNIHIIGVAEREVREQRIENLFEKNTYNRKLPSTGKNINILVHNAQSPKTR